MPEPIKKKPRPTTPLLTFQFSDEDKATFKEAREFEKELGRPYWQDTGVEKGESWASFKRRGCPLTPSVPVVSQDRLDALYPGLVAPQRENAPLPSEKRVQAVVAKDSSRSSAPSAVANKYGIDVQRTSSGRCTVFGEATSSIFRWTGSKGWSIEDCQRLLTNLALEGVAVSSIGILVKAGAKGFRVPILTKDQERKLLQARGK